MCGVAGETPNGIRIGPVYTPTDLRGRGYASAVVAAVSQAELDAGRRFCFLDSSVGSRRSHQAERLEEHQVRADHADRHQAAEQHRRGRGRPGALPERVPDHGADTSHESAEDPDGEPMPPRAQR